MPAIHVSGLCVAMLAAISSSDSIRAQSTHVVGPSGVPQIRDALAVAGPGDLVLVEPGTYAQFTVTQSVTIRAITDGTVFVTSNAAYAQPCGQNIVCIVNAARTEFLLPANGRAHVAGLTFQAGSIPASLTTAYHRVAVTGGEATFENCSFATGGGTAGALVADATRLRLISCSVVSFTSSGSAGGLEATNSEVIAVNSTFGGSSSATRFDQAMPGIRLAGCTLHASHLVATGGSQQFGGNPPAPGLVADAATTLWIGDSTFTAGTTFGTRPCGLVASSLGRLSGCTVTPNSGCTLPPNGSLLTVSRPSPLHIGANFGMQYRTDPNGLFVVLLTIDLQKTVFPFLEQPWWASANAIDLGYFFADPAGLCSVSWPIPNDQYLLDQAVWFHSVALTATLPLQVGPPVGCLIR